MRADVVDHQRRRSRYDLVDRALRQGRRPFGFVRPAAASAHDLGLALGLEHDDHAAPHVQKRGKHAHDVSEHDFEPLRVGQKFGDFIDARQCEIGEGVAAHGL